MAENTRTSKNELLLGMFIAYCRMNPEMRFWQALRNWAGYHFIYAANEVPREGGKGIWDTFHWEDSYKEWPR